MCDTVRAELAVSGHELSYRSRRGLGFNGGREGRAGTGVHAATAHEAWDRLALIARVEKLYEAVHVGTACARPSGPVARPVEEA